VPYGIHGWLGSAYTYTGHPERSVKWDRAQLAGGRDTHASTRASLVITLQVAGCPDEAMAAADGLVETAEATHNPYALSFALMAYGFAWRNADPNLALEAMRRGLVVAQHSGNRTIELPWRPVWPYWKQYTVTRSPHSNNPLWPSATTTTRVTPRVCEPRWLCS
jgi:hypothetical protein